MDLVLGAALKVIEHLSGTRESNEEAERHWEESRRREREERRQRERAER